MHLLEHNDHQVMALHIWLVHDAEVIEQAAVYASNALLGVPAPAMGSDKAILVHVAGGAIPALFA